MYVLCRNSLHRLCNDPSRFPRDQAGAQADPCGGVRGRAQGGLPQDQRQPQDSAETCHQEMVLHPLTGVRTGINMS